MDLTVNQARTFCYTGGRPFDPAKPMLVFIHGVLNDHSVWILQTRWFAHHGYNVLAPDLPGHGKSEGDAPATVQEAAQFVLGLLDAAGVQQATLIGHSFGSLVALEVAAHAPDRVNRLVMVGTAYPMKVSPALLDASLNQPMKAIDMVNQFSHSMLAPPPSSLGPGTWLYGSLRALMRRVLASNTRVNVFHTGFKACDAYDQGEQAMAAVQCPVLFVLGQADQMTPPRSAQTLIGQAREPRVVMVQAGPAVMNEAPDATLDAMAAFLESRTP